MMMSGRNICISPRTCSQSLKKVTSPPVFNLTCVRSRKSRILPSASGTQDLSPLRELAFESQLLLQVVDCLHHIS